MTVIDRTTNTPEAWDLRADQGDQSWDAAMWSEHGQTARFLRVLHHLDLERGDSLLDFGCGTGDLCRWLPDHVGYLGVDWSPGMLARARREHPGRTFTSILPTLGFSHVCAIGTWNLADELAALQGIERLWGLTGDTLVVSVHRDLVPAGALAALHPRFLIDGSHLDNDLILVLRR